MVFDASRQSRDREPGAELHDAMELTAEKQRVSSRKRGASHGVLLVSLRLPWKLPERSNGDAFVSHKNGNLPVFGHHYMMRIHFLDSQASRFFAAKVVVLQQRANQLGESRLADNLLQSHCIFSWRCYERNRTVWPSKPQIACQSLM